MAFPLGIEERVCLSLSSPNPSLIVLEEVARSLSSGRDFDFPKLLALARRNGVLPFLHRNLLKLNCVPEEVRAILRNAYLTTSGLNIANAEETLGIIELLRVAGTEAIPLKGALASELLFGDPGLYLASDIDILVKPSDLERAKEVLVKEGYEYSETGERDLLYSHYHLILHRKSHHVELHWNLAKRYFNVPPGFWWEETQIAEYNGRSLRMLSPERYLLYAIFRLFDHGFRPLKFLVFISALLNAYGHEINNLKLISLARRLKMRRLTLFTLQILHDIYGGVPPGFKERQRIRGYKFLRNRIFVGLFASEPRIHLKMALYIYLLDSPLEVIRVLMRRVFPSVSEIRLRYGLSGRPGKIVLYYLLNPFLLASRRR